jgi:oxygen-independent coproporphyrinogen-3 oxidase
VSCADLLRPEPAGLYIHIPYCATLCSYCDFFREASPEGVPGSFVDSLLRELALYAQGPPVVLDTVYFGGGTPSLLTQGQLEKILGEVRRTFRLEEEAEITLEANPETVGPRRAEAWLRAGVNRLSLGAQSLRAPEVEILGRRCSPERARDAVKTASTEGFEDLSLDLMGGVPGQGHASLCASLREALDLPITHLSFYLLDLHRGTPLFDRVRAGDLDLPDEDTVADLYEETHARMVGAGFEHYEISNFARPGRRCRHNLKYWRGGSYIGAGPSAHGRFRGWLTANPPSVEAWSAALSRGEVPHAHAEKLTERRVLEDSVIFGLRLAEGVPLESVEALAEGDEIAPRIEKLVSGGTAEIDGARLRLTPQGFLLSNEVIAWLLPALESKSGDR